MRIAIVNKYARVTGGADRHCLELADALRKAGHSVAFLSTASPENEETQGVFLPCSVTRESRSTLRRFDQLGVAMRAFWNRTAAYGMERLLDEFRPDVVHLHKLYPQLSVAPVVAAARRTPIVQTLHDYELVSASAVDSSGSRFDRDEEHLRYRLLNSATLPVRIRVHTRRVSTFVAVSLFVARVYKRYGINASVLANFVPTVAVDEEPLPFRDRQGVVFAGRLVWEKGVSDVLELARLLPNISVAIAGRGPLADVVCAAASRLPNLTYRGALEASPLMRLLRGARVVFMPSQWDEPGPLGALEAMSVGTPIVAAARGGLAEYVSNAKAGYVINGVANAYAQACLHLHEDEAAWTKASTSATTSAVSRHSRDAYVTRLLDLYAEAA
jgi:glycosyltransferase involved in cell wall biosynthesis